MGSSGGLYFPIRLRCADASSVLSNPDMGDAIARALGRSFARAKTALPEEVALGEGVWLHAPTLGDTTLSPDENARVLEIVNRAIEEAARAASLPRFEAPKRSAMVDAPVEDEAGTDIAGDSRAEISEQFDPDRYTPDTGEYEIPSYNGGKKKIPLRFKQDPFEELLEAYDAAISATDTLLELTGKLSKPNDTRSQAVGLVRSLRGDLYIERDNLETLDDIYLGNVDESTLGEIKRQILGRYFNYFFNRQGPDRGRIAKRMEQLKLGLVLSAMIRAHVAELDARVANLTKPEESYLREITMDVGSYYLEAVGMSQELGQRRILFLEDFYSDPQILVFYAVARFVREQLPILWKNLGTATNYVLGPIEQTNLGPPVSMDPFWVAQYIAIDRALILQTLLDNHGTPVADLPREPGAIGTPPDAKLLSNLSANVLQLEIEVPVLNLWKMVQQLIDAMAGEMYVGVSLFSGDDDRKKWLGELHTLRDSFRSEVSRADHKDFDQRAKDWEKSVERLRKDIYEEIRSIKIRQKIGDQIPLLIVTGGVAGGIGLWVAEVTDGSVWLVVFAEGATMTLFNAAFAPAGSRPTTALGWATELGTNFLLAGIGQFFKALAPSSEFLQGLSPVRRALLTTSLRAGAIGSTTFLQTAIQSIEAQARNEGGESSFTEMLTLNLAVNGLGALFGAALHAEPRRTGSTSPALSTPEEIRQTGRGRGVNITEQAAKDWLDLANRAQEFTDRNQRIAHDAKAGKLSEADFNKWKEEAKKLTAELESKLPPLAEILDVGLSSQEIKAKLADLRARIEKTQYTGVRLLLPEYTAGLKQVGDSQTFVYDPENVSTQKLQKLREFQEKNGTITELPGGGWEVRDSNGKIVFQILELPAGTSKALLPSLDALAGSADAQRGLARVTSPTGLVQDVGESAPSLKSVPELRSQITHAAISSPETAKRLLEIVGRSDVPPSIEALRGLSNYLKLGGNPETLAKALSFRDFRERATESKNHVERVLTNMETWDRTAVNGFELLLNRVRPWTATSSEVRGSLDDLFANHEPEQVRGIMQAIDVLAPRSRGLARVIASLMTQGISNQRGGMGELTAGVKAAERYPGKIISFQSADQTPEGFRRVQDIVVIEPATSTTPERRLFSQEVKEVSTASLGSRAPHELAVDIRLDSVERQRRIAAGETPGPLFDTFKWQVRDLEIKQLAIEALQQKGNSNPNAGDIELMKLDIVRRQLRRAFQDPALNALDGVELRAYQKEFETRLPFVEFF